ncbi:hypothetical protein [Heliomicrobium undosum]|nr:hypothetical protein [Heliomicrobium undosum]
MFLDESLQEMALVALAAARAIREAGEPLTPSCSGASIGMRTV